MKTRDKEGGVTCPKPHSPSEAELGFQSDLPDSKPPSNVYRSSYLPSQWFQPWANSFLPEPIPDLTSFLSLLHTAPHPRPGTAMAASEFKRERAYLALLASTKRPLILQPQSHVFAGIKHQLSTFTEMFSGIQTEFKSACHVLHSLACQVSQIINLFSHDVWPLPHPSF